MVVVPVPSVTTMLVVIGLALLLTAALSAAAGMLLQWAENRGTHQTPDSAYLPYSGPGDSGPGGSTVTDDVSAPDPAAPTGARTPEAAGVR